jgi:D-inositol-3-phosphate glycosyltransferase
MVRSPGHHPGIHHEPQPIVLQLGRMVPRKGVDNVIRGVGRLCKARGVSARLLIVGGDSRDPESSTNPEIKRLREIAREEGVQDTVTFVGSRDRHELRNYYAAADVFVSTPWYEPFGITPVEAMACGTPVIGSAVGGIKTTVLDGETGYLVPPNDPEALADRLSDLLLNGARKTAFGHRAVRHANAFYTWRRVTQSIADLYEELLDRRRTRRVTAAEAARAPRSATSQVSAYP